MGKIQWAGGALLAPIPAVLVTCGSAEKSNVFTVAWTGIVNTHPPMTYISVRPSRYSYNLIRESGEFIIHLTTAEQIRKVDFCGIYTGRKVNKWEKCGLATEPAKVVKCPLLSDAPLALECRVTQVLPLGTHDMFLAEIVATDVEESLLDENGKLCLERAHLAAFGHGRYFALGEPIGTFGFSTEKPKKKGSRGANQQPAAGQPTAERLSAPTPSSESERERERERERRKTSAPSMAKSENAVRTKKRPEASAKGTAKPTHRANKPRAKRPKPKRFD